MSVQAAEGAFRAGDVSGALAQLTLVVRQRPQEAKLRVFLAQLLMMQGQWDRVLNQLQVLADLDAGALPMVHAYRSAVQCEQFRAEVFAGRRSPMIFGEPEPWIASLVQALALDPQRQASQAATLREQALEQAPASSGSVNGASFAWLADADSRLGPVFEVMLNGAYYWVPVHRVSSIKIEAPSDVRDFVWLPATFTWSNGGEAIGLIPTRYPGSEHSSDQLVQMGRKTQWVELAPNQYAGSGQRELVTDSGDFGLLDLREVRLVAAG
jgi:type VI secretion system protein ImpE